MSTKIIDADPRFPVYSSIQYVAAPIGFCRCVICKQLVHVLRYHDHLTLHQEIIHDLRRNKR